MRQRIAACTTMWLLTIVLGMVTTADAGNPEAHEVPLTPGWDIFIDPLTQGKVIWHVPEGQQRLLVTFLLKGVLPEHAYTVGASFFQAGTDVNFGDGKNLEGTAMATRDGVTADVDAWDFGVLFTDAAGDGEAHFNLSPNAGTYHVQFTVRIGGPPGCPETDCAVLYRTGFRYSVYTEEIIIPGPASALPTLTLTLAGCLVCQTGDPFTVQGRLRNPASHPTSVEIKIGVRLPDGTPVNLSGKHLEWQLATGFEALFTVIDTPWPPGLPPGIWTVEGTLVEPELGTTFSREVLPFKVLP